MFRTVQKGSRSFKRFKKVQESSKRFNKIHGHKCTIILCEGSNAFQEGSNSFQEDSSRFDKV